MEFEDYHQFDEAEFLDYITIRKPGILPRQERTATLTPILENPDQTIFVTLRDNDHMDLAPLLYNYRHPQGRTARERARKRKAYKRTVVDIFSEAKEAIIFTIPIPGEIRLTNLTPQEERNVLEAAKKSGTPVLPIRYDPPAQIGNRVVQNEIIVMRSA